MLMSTKYSKAGRRRNDLFFFHLLERITAKDNEERERERKRKNEKMLVGTEREKRRKCPLIDSHQRT